MRILVTGANGMLGIDLCQMLEEAGNTVIRTDVSAHPAYASPRWETLDITDTHAVRASLLGHQPDAVIHCAAYTDVDGCTRDPDRAFRINGFGTWNLASICGGHNIVMVYISTDFVFDGTKREPYTEFDATNPISPYGASKLAGERYVTQLCRRHFIARTSWLFGVHGKSFPSTMIDLAKTRTELSVVTDEIGSPTHTVDLARTLIELLYTELYGTYHIANAGQCSRFEMAQKTFELAGITTTELKTICADQYPSPTRRPSYSVLRRYSLEIQGRDNLPPWQQALAHFISLRTAAH